MFDECLNICASIESVSVIAHIESSKSSKGLYQILSGNVETPLVHGFNTFETVTPRKRPVTYQDKAF
jgi:hypothetical protein